MGQQQLLLLVLSTVIVGLATVAGIQAFSENQAQASQDALVQKGTSIASDIQGLAAKPTQLGGIDADGISDASKIVDRLGYDSNPVDVPGAGSNGECEIKNNSNSTEGTIDVVCTSDDAPQTVTVGVTPSNSNSSSDVVSTSFSS
jgi:hypothetical protein